MRSSAWIHCSRIRRLLTPWKRLVGASTTLLSQRWWNIGREFMTTQYAYEHSFSTVPYDLLAARWTEYTKCYSYNWYKGEGLDQRLYELHTVSCQAWVENWCDRIAWIWAIFFSHIGWQDYIPPPTWFPFESVYELMGLPFLRKISQSFSLRSGTRWMSTLRYAPYTHRRNACPEIYIAEKEP